MDNMDNDILASFRALLHGQEPAQPAAKATNPTISNIHDAHLPEAPNAPAANAASSLANATDATITKSPENLPKDILPQDILTDSGKLWPSELSLATVAVSPEDTSSLAFGGMDDSAKLEIANLFAPPTNPMHAMPQTVPVANLFDTPSRVSSAQNQMAVTEALTAQALAASRTQSLETVIQPDVPDEETEKHLLFLVGGGKFSVPLTFIIEITDVSQCTPVPNVPYWVHGITNLRGDILSVVDFRGLLDDVQSPPPLEQNLLVTQTMNGDLTICLLIDRVLGVANVQASRLETLDRMNQSLVSAHTQGFYPHDDSLFNVLDIEGLLRALEIND